MAPTVTPPPAPTSKLLYSGPAGKVWADGAELFQFRARGVRVQSVMPGSPTQQPTPAEMEAVQAAAKNAYGPLKPWMVLAASFLFFLLLSLLRAPLWLTLLLGGVVAVALVAVPLRRQYQAFADLFAGREDLTLLLSDVPTQAVSRMVEVGPDTPARELGAQEQPVAVVVRGLAATERVKLAGAVLRHTLPAQLGRR